MSKVPVNASVVKEIIDRLKTVECSLLKSIEGEHPLDRIEQVICIIEKIVRIKILEKQIKK